VKIEFTLVDDTGNTYQGTAQLRAVGPASAAKDVRPLAAGNIDPKGLPAHILALRESGFFREPRTAAEVHAGLSETYHCLIDRVQMALLRMQRKRELRKATKRIGEQDFAAYVW
jgi:hypothetical protein